jgi:hypothetical protein
MRFVRSIWCMRLFVAVSMLSLFPALVAPMAHVGRHVAGSRYDDWLRAQLRGAPDAAFEAAADRALAESPRSLQGFLTAFVEAYGDADTLVPAFTGAVVQADDLVELLSQRYSRLVGDAIAPDVFWKAASVRALLLDRADRVAILVETRLSVAAGALVRRLMPASGRPAPLRHLLSAAQPLGP